MTIAAPGKVNLWLAVLGRRPDGYHELDTGLCAIELCDLLTLERASGGGIVLAVRGPAASDDVAADATNLAWRAAERALALCRERGAAAPSDGVRIVLEKHVPSRAGLGGGSSDAAAAFAGCEILFGAELPERGRELGALGSDCAFFAAARATGVARCRGRGEDVQPLPAPARAWSIALVAPAAGASTRDVYAALDDPLSAPRASTTVPIAVLAEPASTARQHLFNDLERPASRVLPQWIAWRDALDAAGASHFRLSGSGSSFFGLFDETDEARGALDRVLHAARVRSLAVRGSWITRPFGQGVQPLEIL